jgi:hypothetical protein
MWLVQITKGPLPISYEFECKACDAKLSVAAP